MHGLPTSVVSELVTFALIIVPESMYGVAEKVEIAQQKGNSTSRDCESVKSIIWSIVRSCFPVQLSSEMVHSS